MSKLIKRDSIIYIKITMNKRNLLATIIYPNRADVDKVNIKKINYIYAQAKRLTTPEFDYRRFNPECQKKLFLLNPTQIKLHSWFV